MGPAEEENVDGDRKACGWRHLRASSTRNMFGDESATEAVLAFMRGTKDRMHGRRGRSPRERKPTLECTFPWKLYIFPLFFLLLFISCGSGGEEKQVPNYCGGSPWDFAGGSGVSDWDLILKDTAAAMEIRLHVAG